MSGLSLQDITGDRQPKERNPPKKCKRCGREFTPLSFIDIRGTSNRQYCYDYACDKARNKELEEKRKERAREYNRRKRARSKPTQ